MKKEDLKITTYQDGEEYVFISYSSDDEDIVFDKYVVPLQEKYGLRIFCDKNFKNRANQTWTEQMINNIKSASCCLLFISSTYAASYACLLEVFNTVHYKVPVLKIQLESPNEIRDFKASGMSDSTKKAFLKIGKQLSNAGLKEAENCYLDIQDHVEKGMISKYDVSSTFCNYLNQIACTKLNEKDGLDAIVSSLSAIQKDKGKADVFGDTLKDVHRELKSQEPTKVGAIEEIPPVNEEKVDMEAEVKPSDNLLYFKNARLAVGEGYWTLLAGSEIALETKGYCGAKKQREECIRQNKVEKKDNCYITLCDLHFTSLSGAACFVSGSSENGNIVWKKTPAFTKTPVEASESTGKMQAGPVSSRIDQILRVIKEIDNQPKPILFYNKAISQAATKVAEDLNINKSTVDDKCQRQLKLSADGFASLVEQHVNGNSEPLKKTLLAAASKTADTEVIQSYFK